MRTTLGLVLAALLLLASGCAGAHVREGDGYMKDKKYDEALAAYKTAHKIHPTNRVEKRIAKAEKRLAETWVKKGNDAAKIGAWDEAATWWKQAAQLRPNDDKPGSPRVVIAQNAPELENCGDANLRMKKWEASFRCWEGLQLAYPDRVDLQEKIETAHRGFAADLDRDAQNLAKKGLEAAALVIMMRARTYDPLQAGGYERETQYRRQVATASHVNIASVSIDDRGNWGLAAYLTPALNRRLGEYPPYGPGKGPQAVQVAFTATIEEFGWRDEITHGYTRKDVPDAPVTGKDKTTNPEWAAQKAIVDALEKELKWMEAAAAKGNSGASVEPAPAPTPATAGKGGKPAAAPAATPAPSKKVPPARAPTADEIAAKKKALDAAKKKLAELDEKVSAAEASTVYYIHWTEVRRVASAKVRFEVREPDFPEPVVKTVEMFADAKDRGHDANEAHKVAADPVQLPSIESLVSELAANLAGPGTETILDARSRRADRWIERGREARNKGLEDDALDLYVRALFAKGIEGGSLPGDAATVVAIRLEKGQFRDIVTGP